MSKNITFSDSDFYNFSKACNIKVDMKFAMENFFNNGVQKVAEGNKNVFVHIYFLCVGAKTTTSKEFFFSSRIVLLRGYSI